MSTVEQESARAEGVVDTSTQARRDAAVRRELARARRRRGLHVGLAILVPVLLLAMWEIYTDVGWMDSRLFPAPHRILGRIGSMLADGTLQHDLYPTLGRILVGLAIGAVVGVAVGLLMGAFAPVNAAFGTTFAALYALPKIAVLPLLLLIFGLTETPKVLAVAISVFFVMQINTVAGVRQIDARVLEAGTAYGATGWRRFRFVIVPATIPYVFSGLRISAGMAVIVVTAVEFVASNTGLGYLIWNSWQLFQPEQMYVGLLVVSVLGAVLTGLIVALEWLCVPWRRSRIGRRQRPSKTSPSASAA